MALDTTFLRFLGMNWEMIGLRCRATRTLYLTRLQPHVKNTPFCDEYGKIQIAFKIASLIDWRERHPDGAPGSSSGEGHGGVDRYQNGEREEDEKGGGARDGGKDGGEERQQEEEHGEEEHGTTKIRTTLSGPLMARSATPNIPIRRRWEHVPPEDDPQGPSADPPQNIKLPPLV